MKLSGLLSSAILLWLVLHTVSCDFLGRTNSSNLCSSLPRNSCVHQLKNMDTNATLTSESCSIQVANTSKNNCNHFIWNEAVERCQDEDACGVFIEVYRHTPVANLSLYRTALNLSLSNTSTHSINLKYTDVSSSTFHFCLNFTFQFPFLPINSLWYDCVFHNRSFEGQAFQLEFLSDNKYGMFLFNIPTERSLRNGKGFVYIHAHRMPELILSFQDMSQDRDIVYSVVVCRWMQNGCHVEVQQDVDFKNSTTYINRFRSIITVSMGHLWTAGNYSVRVEDNNCSASICYQATSPPFTIHDAQEAGIYILAGLVIVVVAVVVTTIICLKRRKISNEGKKSRTLLLLHDHATSDFSMVETISVFLEKWGGFNVLLDIIDIPKSKHKDPLLWYSNAMEKANIVAVIAGRADSHMVKKQPASIYSHTFELAIELLTNRISQSLIKKQRNIFQHFILLEAYSPCVIPDICKSFARFRIPEQSWNLMRYVSRERKTFSDCAIIEFLEHKFCKSDRNPAIAFLKIQEQISGKNIVIQNMSASYMPVESECTSLLESDGKKERDLLRDKLDREFGPNIIGTNDLPTLGLEQ